MRPGYFGTVGRTLAARRRRWRRWRTQGLIVGLFGLLIAIAGLCLVGQVCANEDATRSTAGGAAKASTTTKARRAVSLRMDTPSDGSKGSRYTRPTGGTASGRAQSQTFSFRSPKLKERTKVRKPC
jgi:uncharacterized iron-regulated membrane protein